MKRMKSALAVALAVITVAVMLVGCSQTGESIMQKTYENYENLAASCMVTDSAGKESHRFKLKGDAEENNYVTVDLGAITAFNTVVLHENGDNVTLFEIYGSKEPDIGYEFLYQSDCIEGGHTCFLGDVEYRYLRIFVNQASGNFTLDGIEVYDIKSDDAQDLRVSAYFVANDINENTDFSRLDGVTDVILFGTSSFDKDGNIRFTDSDGNENEQFFAERVDMLKAAIGNRDINIICDVGLPYGNDNADIITLFGENVDRAVESVADLLEKYDFDGFDLDYEFPYKKIEWKQLNDFMRKLDKKIPDKLISLAVAPWDLRFDEDVIQIIDRAEVMLYDMFTAHNYHSTFPVTVNGIDKMLKGGFSPKQLDLGLPFYSRPTNRLAFWGSYAQFSDSLDRYTNLIYYNGFDHSGNPMTAPQYINSPQMIADKTAFAIDSGLGGVMVWHLNCDLPYDNELSLFRSISETKQAKQA